MYSDLLFRAESFGGGLESLRRPEVGQNGRKPFPEVVFSETFLENVLGARFRRFGVEW